MKKTKRELQKILSNTILARYKIAFPESQSDLFCNEAIATLIVELENNAYEDVNIKTPIPYFTGVLKNKHKEMTGQEITNTDIRRRQIQAFDMSLQNIKFGFYFLYTKVDFRIPFTHTRINFKTFLDKK